MKQSLGLLEVSGLARHHLRRRYGESGRHHAARPEKTNGSGWMVVKIAGDVASVRAAVMTGAELAERQQGLVAQKVIAAREGLLPARVRAFTSA